MHCNHAYVNKNILIVDDQATNILLLTNMLEDYGYKFIHSASSAKKAYEVLENKKIDLILLDVMMPEIDGIEACQKIRTLPRYKQTPIIMVTADNTDETLKKSFNAGADDFTVKPINFVNLNSRIQNVFMHREKDELILNQTRSAAINDIIDALAHQWRQPLSAISATAMNIGIANELDDLDKDSLDRHLQQISTYTQELSKTIDEIREIARVDYEAIDTNINKLITHIVSIIESGYQDHDITVELELQEDTEKIFIYPNELMRVVLNILINSQEAFIRNKFDQKRFVKVITSQNEKYTKISIKDNAGGIDSKQITKVFDPYFSTKQEKNGKGLGLHNCKQIIELHQGGNIKIESRSGTTEVVIELLNEYSKLNP